MSHQLTQSCPPSGDQAEWDRLGLDAALDSVVDGAELRNVRPDGADITAGEAFAVLEELRVGPATYAVIFATDWCNDWAPWSATVAEVYDLSDPADAAKFKADCAYWESRPEEYPGAEWDDDDSEPDDDDDDSEPDDDDDDETGYEVIVGNIGSVYHGPDPREADAIFADYVAHSTGSPGHRCFGEHVTMLETITGRLGAAHYIAKEHVGHNPSE